jgi:hypothetical protein
MPPWQLEFELGQHLTLAAWLRQGAGQAVP